MVTFPTKEIKIYVKFLSTCSSLIKIRCYVTVYSCHVNCSLFKYWMRQALARNVKYHNPAHVGGRDLPITFLLFPSFSVTKAVTVRTAKNGACEKHRRYCGCSLSVNGVALSLPLQVQTLLQKDQTNPALEEKSHEWPRWCHRQHPSDPHQQPL